jgi:cytochrome b6-f complex iron-sulfur subunit
MTGPEATSRRAAIAALSRFVAFGGSLAATTLASCSSVLARLGGAQRTRVGRLDELPPGGGLRASLGGDDSVIVVNVDGSVRAFRAVCTHEGCPLGWNAQQHLIRCPCHGGAYDTNGRVVSGPPPAPLTALRVAVDHGAIYVRH